MYETEAPATLNLHRELFSGYATTRSKTNRMRGGIR